MPDWKQEIRKRLANQQIDPAREESMIDELSQHLEDRYEELRSSAGEPEALERVFKELEGSDSFSASLPIAKSRFSRNATPQAAAASGNLLSDLRRDLRFGLRSMIKTPGFSIFVVLTLALGIGASTTVFTIVNTLLLHPLPARDPSGLVCVYTTDVKNGRQSDSLLPTSYPNLQDLQSRDNVFDGFAGFSPPMVMTLTEATGSERFFGELVTQGYFETLGLTPATGRFFRAAEISTTGSAPVAVLSYSAWKIRFDSDPAIVGRTLELNGVPFTVVGVAPQGFLGISAVFGPDVWVPATMATLVLPASIHDVLRERAKPFFQTVARLKPGVSRSQAEASLQTSAAALEREYPGANAGHTISVHPITTALYSSMGGERGMTFASVVLLVIVGLVLLIACSNVANLLMARALSRRNEIAVRLATGASRGRLIRQLLTESLLLGFCGGVVGLGLGYEGCQFLWSFRPPDVVRNLTGPRIDSTVFLFALFLSLVTGLIFGVLPSLRASKTGLVDSLKEESRIAGMSTRGARSQKILLIGQMAISLVSLIAASVFLRAVDRAYEIDPGFDHKHLAVFLMNPEQTGYDATRLQAFHHDVRDRVAAIPGVEAVSWASNMPFWSNASRGILIEGQQQASKSDTLTSVTNTVDLDYFKTMRIPLLQGRAFEASDQDASLPVAIINEDLARRYWPEGNVLGKSFRLAGDTVARQIVGVAKNSDYTTLGEAPQPCIYLPLRQNAGGNFNLYVRTVSDPSQVLEAVQREIKEMAPNVEVSDVRTGTTLMGQILFSARMVRGMLGIFGLLALALASVGLYGILAYSVSGRQHEIGVRMALGASRSAVLRLVVREGMWLVCVGIGIGLAISLLTGRVFSRMLFGLSPADPLSLAGASAVLILVSMLACYLPALAASRMDPMKALRES